MVPCSGTRSPSFQPNRVGQILADDHALAIAEPGLDLLGRHLELGVDLQERLGIDGDVGEEVRRVLIDAVEPGVVRDQLDARHRLQPRLVREGQRHDQAHLVDEHQPVESGDLDAERERVADRHQDAEQQERDEDRQQREGRAELAPPDVLPDERQEFHAAMLPASTPLSRCSVRRARSAACGSWVTMTMVLP